MSDAETLSSSTPVEVVSKETDPIISPHEAFAASQLAVSRLLQPQLFDLDTASSEWKQHLVDLADAIAVHATRITMEEGIDQGAVVLNAAYASGGIETHTERLHTAVFAEGLRTQDSSRYIFEGSPDASLEHGAKMLLPFLRRALPGESGLSIKSSFGGLTREEEMRLAKNIFAGLVVAYKDRTFLDTGPEVSDDARGAMVQAITHGDFKTAAHAAVDMHAALYETIVHPAKVSLAHGNDDVSIGVSRILPFAKEKAPEEQKACLTMLREADLTTVTDAVVLSLGQFTKKDRAHHPDRYLKATILLENLSEALYGTRDNVPFASNHIRKFITKVDTAFQNEGGKSDVSLYRSLSFRDRAGVVALILHQTDDIRGKLRLISKNPEIVHTLDAIQGTALGRKITEGWRGAVIASNTSAVALQSVLEVQHSFTDRVLAFAADKLKLPEPGSHGALKQKSHLKRNIGLFTLISVALATAACGTAQPPAVDHSPTPPPDSPTPHPTDTATATTLTATNTSTPTATIVPTPSPILSLDQFKLKAIINGATDDDFKGLTGPDASSHLKFRTDLQDLVAQLQAGRDLSGDPRFSVLRQTTAWNELKKLCGPGSDCVVRSSIFKGDAAHPFRIAHFLDLGDKILFLGLQPDFRVNPNTTQLLPKLVAPSGEKLIPYEVFDFGLTTSGCSLAPSDKNPASRFVFAGKDNRIIAYQTYFGNGFAQIVVIDHYAFFGEKNKVDFPDVCGKAFAIGNDEKTGSTFGAYYEVKDGVIDYSQAMNAAGDFGIARLEFGRWVWHLDPTKTPTASKTPSQTPTPTRTQTFTPTPTNTLTLTPSRTPSPTVTLAATIPTGTAFEIGTPSSTSENIRCADDPRAKQIYDAFKAKNDIQAMLKGVETRLEQRKSNDNPPSWITLGQKVLVVGEFKMDLVGKDVAGYKPTKDSYAMCYVVVPASDPDTWVVVVGSRNIEGNQVFPLYINGIESKLLDFESRMRNSIGSIIGIDIHVGDSVVGPTNVKPPFAMLSQDWASFFRSKLGYMLNTKDPEALKMRTFKDLAELDNGKKGIFGLMIRNLY